MKTRLEENWIIADVAPNGGLTNPRIVAENVSPSPHQRKLRIITKIVTSLRFGPWDRLQFTYDPLVGSMHLATHKTLLGRIWGRFKNLREALTAVAFYQQPR